MTGQQGVSTLVRYAADSMVRVDSSLTGTAGALAGTAAGLADRRLAVGRLEPVLELGHFQNICFVSLELC